MNIILLLHNFPLLICKEIDFLNKLPQLKSKLISRVEQLSTNEFLINLSRIIKF